MSAELRRPHHDLPTDTQHRPAIYLLAKGAGGP